MEAERVTESVICQSILIHYQFVLGRLTANQRCRPDAQSGGISNMHFIFFPARGLCARIYISTSGNHIYLSVVSVLLM